MKTVITTRHLDTDQVEVFGNFKKACRIQGLPYHTLKKWRLPIIYGNYIIERIKYQ